MIELRWLTRHVEPSATEIIEFPYYGRDPGTRTVTVLQYRQKIDTTIRAGGPGTWDDSSIQKTANYQWSDWHDVPTVTEGTPRIPEPIMMTNATNKCPKCGILLEGAMSYYCTQPSCPTGLGSSMS